MGASHPYTPLGLLFALSLLALLACQGSASEKKAGSQAASLQFKNGQLSLLRSGQAHQLKATTPVPYRIVSSSDSYSLVTTAGSDLNVATYSTDGSNVRRFADILPQLVQPPVCALHGLADTAAGGATGVVLLGAGGEQVWTDPHADLLWPVAGPTRRDAFSISAGRDTNPLGIYGLQPALLRIECPAGRELWRKSIPTDEYVEDAVIYGIGTTHGLLCLQYGTDLFEFFTFDLAGGAMQPVHKLDGSPTYRNIYPGPIPEPLGVGLQGDKLDVTVMEVSGGWKLLSFDLKSGSVESTEAEPQSLMAERNPHPLGGSGAARPALFPQGILPTQSGASWTIPALLNKQGQVLVATPSGASWVTPE